MLRGGVAEGQSDAFSTFCSFVIQGTSRPAIPPSPSILDRLVHNDFHRIELRGEFMRKKRNPRRDESDQKKERSYSRAAL